MKIHSFTRFVSLTAVLLTGALLISACAPAPIYTRSRTRPEAESKQRKAGGKQESVPTSFYKGQVLIGEASFYGPGFHGKLTANGEIYDQNGLTCASKELPFDTQLRITLLATGKSVIVRVNDRGPYKKGRILDLSVEAARRIGMVEMGTGSVRAEVLSLGNK